MSRRTQAKEKFPRVAPAIVDEIFDNDPSRGAYGMWMVGRVAAGEGIQEVLTTVVAFHERKRRLPDSKRDLYGYKDVPALYEALVELDPESNRSKRRQAPGYHLLQEYPSVVFYQVDTFPGMRRLGRDTKWCTTELSSYEEYEGCVFVVAVNKTREGRHPFSKLAIVQSRASVDRDKFIPWHIMKKKAKRGLEVAYEVYDAKDSCYHTGRHQESPLEALIDALVGKQGVVEAVMAQAMGGDERVKIYQEVLAVLGNHGESRAKKKDVIECARKAATFGLFNPLSLMDHPLIRTEEASRQIWDIATKDQQETLDHGALKQLAERPAVNIPEVFAMFMHTGYHRTNLRDLHVLLRNKHLSAETKERVMGVVGKILKIDGKKPPSRRPSKR